MSFENYDEDDKPKGGFLRRNRLPVVIFGLMGLAAATAVVAFPSQKGTAPRKAPEPEVMVQIRPLPPQPPPPQAPPPPEEKMEEQKDIQETVEEEPEASPEPVVGTNLKGPGPGISGLGNKSNFGKGRTLGGSKGGRFDGYAKQVQSGIMNALRRHSRTRSSVLAGIKVRIWVDASGRISRAALTDSTGDRALDAALTNEVLTGCQLSAPPPSDMRMPITLMLSATRPN